MPTENELTPEYIDKALAEIERTLEQMLDLAHLSATALDLDRAAMQKNLDKLKAKIDRIADTL